MIHLSSRLLNNAGQAVSTKVSIDPLSSALNSLQDLYETMTIDMSNYCIVSNLYLDLAAGDFQFIAKLEILYGIKYNEFKKGISELADAIDLGIMSRRYVPLATSLKRLAPFENHQAKIKINIMLLDEMGNLMLRRL